MKRSKIVLLILSVFGLFWIILFSLNLYKSTFWDTGIYQLLQLAVIVSISYYLVQHKTDARKKIDIIDLIIKHIAEYEGHFKDDLLKYVELLNAESGDYEQCQYLRQRLLSNGRKISNYISHLESEKFKDKLTERLKNVKKYWDDFYFVFDSISPRGKTTVAINSEVLKQYNLLDEQLTCMLLDLY